MKLEMWPIEKLKPYEKNPRINEDSVEPTANSIKRFGFLVPAVIKSDGTLITGHTRLKAAKKAGLKEIPVIIADYLSDEDARGFRMADNKTGEKSTWDEALLAEELERIFSFDMADFGFLRPELDEYDFSDFDEENENLSGEETNIIKISVPGKYVDQITEWLANGERKTAVGMGLGVMKRCGLH